MTKHSSGLSADAKKLLNFVPADGEFIGNTSLLRRSKLGRKYWEVRQELINAGTLTRGKGRGGSVARFAAAAPTTVGEARRSRQHVGKESELYEPLRDWLRDTWGADVLAGDFFEVCTTATPRGKGRKGRLGGKWSRPDVTIVQVNNFDYLAMPILEVTTFEVKKFSDAEDIKAVYETAAHSRWAHFSFLVAEVPDGDYEFPERFMSELERFNLGLILMWREKGHWHFEQEEWESDRLNPDPRELDALLKAFFKVSEREKEYKQAIRK